jgi:hypothetical protein
MAKQTIDNLDLGLEVRTKINENFTELYNTPYKTIKKTIGGVGVASCDFNFVTAEDQVEQVIDLGAILPAFARLVDTFVVTNNTFTGAVSLGIEVGTTSGGNEVIATADLITAGAINQIATGSSPKLNISGTAVHIYVSGTPGANWSLNTAGKLTIYISYIDITNV